MASYRGRVHQASGRLYHLLAPNTPVKVAALSTAQHPLASLPIKERLAALRSNSEVLESSAFLSAPGSAAAASEPPSQRTVLPYQQFLSEDQPNEIKHDTLFDSYRRKHTYLRISLTERCNLRCTYCMPADGVDLQPKDDLLAPAEIVRLASVFTQLGVDKIRLTGGEACDPSGLRELAITTNGLQLARRLPGLLDAGLTGVNISLDTLQEEKFRRMTRRAGSDRVLAAVHAAVAAPLSSPVKVNCVVMGGVNEEDMQPMAALARELPLHMRFIEYMPFDDNQWDARQGGRGGMVPFKKMLATIMGHFPELQAADDSGRVILAVDSGSGATHPSSHAIAKLYSAPQWAGAVGFITSMTSAFCGGCSRLRLTADGSLKVCLFGNTEVSLRDAMRAGVDDDGLRRIIQGALLGKAWAYGGHSSPAEIAASGNRPMILIGG